MASRCAANSLIWVPEIVVGDSDVKGVGESVDDDGDLITRAAATTSPAKECRGGGEGVTVVAVVVMVMVMVMARARARVRVRVKESRTSG